jgi:hypothetical protein
MLIERRMKMNEVRLIKSYIWHGEQCFFVSTIDRDSSAPEGGVFSETMIWEFSWEENKRGKRVGEFSGSSGSLTKHILCCQCLHDDGNLKAMRDE